MTSKAPSLTVMAWPKFGLQSYSYQHDQCRSNSQAMIHVWQWDTGLLTPVDHFISDEHWQQTEYKLSSISLNRVNVRTHPTIGVKRFLPLRINNGRSSLHNPRLLTDSHSNWTVTPVCTYHGIHWTPPSQRDLKFKETLLGVIIPILIFCSASAMYGLFLIHQVAKLD